MSNEYYDPKFELLDYKGNYPINQLEEVRRYLIEECLKPARTSTEMEIKRKCAVFTSDVIDYYKYDKKPEYFCDISTLINDVNSNPFKHSILDIDEDDLIPDNLSQTSLSSLTSEANLSQMSEKRLASSSSSCSFSSFQHGVFKNTPEDDLKKLSHDLNLAHGCEKRFCPCDLPTSITIDDPNDLIYACDFCLKTFNSENRIKEHLDEANHASASEYILQSKKDDSSSTQSKYDEYFSELKPKIKYLRSRSLIRYKKWDTANEFQFAVFCPKCHFYFGNKVLAASLHFKYCHSYSRDDEIYSIAKLDRSLWFEVEKSHVCYECKSYFKKLTDLIKHFEKTKHFPSNLTNEINVYMCPFDQCCFKSTNYFSFKTHIVQHSYFNNPKQSTKVEANVLIYRLPEEFFHITKFKETNQTKLDNQNELEGIENLLKIIKDHPSTAELYRKVQERKTKVLSFLGKN